MDETKDFKERFFEAERLRDEGKLGEALDLYHELVSHRLDTVTNPAEEMNNYDAIMIERLADLSQLFGNVEASIDLLSGLQQLYHDVGNTFFYINTTIKIATVYLECGELQGAFGLLEELEPFIGDPHQIEMNPRGLKKWELECEFEGLEAYEKAIVYTKTYYLMGALLTSLGQYGEGLACLERGIEWSGSCQEDIHAAMYALLLLKKVEAQMEKGDVTAAKLTLDTASVKPLKNDTSGSWINYLELKARISLMRGEFGKAVDCISKTIDICNKFNFVKGEITATLNYVKIKIILNQLVEAVELLVAVQKTCEELGDDATLAQVAQLSDLLERRGRPMDFPLDYSPPSQGSRQKNVLVQDEAPAGEIMEPRQQVSFLGVFEERGLQLQLLIADRQYKEAQALLEHMKVVFSRTDSHLIQIRLEVFELLLAYCTRQQADLHIDLRQIQNYFQEESLIHELWQFQRIILWAGLLPPEEDEVLVKHNEQLLDQMTLSLPYDKQALFWLNKWTDDENFLKCLVDDLMAIKLDLAPRWRFLKPLWAFKSWRRLNWLLFLIDRHKNILAHQSIGGKEPEEAVKKPTFFLRSLFNHPWDRITISFLVLPDRVVLVYRSFFKMDFKVLPLSRIELRQKLRALHENLRRVNQNRDISRVREFELRKNASDQIQEISVSLGLQDILSNLPTRIKRITFVPDDVLNGFPFAALRYNGDYLINRFSVSLGYESSSTRKTKRVKGRDEFLMVGVSRVAAENYDFAELPGARNEVSQLAIFFEGQSRKTEALFNQKADKLVILKKMAHARFFHIACHGYFDRKKPEETGLVLHDGDKLLLRDILNSESFNGVEHVTLSSCWGADHFILPGRWVVSLPETLWRSGVGGILGCLWQVNDEVAVSFMREFYRQMKQHPRDIALQETQKLALNDKIPGAEGRTKDLFFWSGFNLYGAYDRVRF